MTWHIPSLTLALVSAFGLLLTLYVVAGRRWLPRGEVRGFGLLGLMLLITLAVTAATPWLPPWVGPLSGALALGCGVLTLVLAFMRFLRQPVQWARLGLAFLVYASMAALGALRDDEAERIALVALAFAAFVLPLAVSVQRHGWQAERALRLVSVMLWALTLLALWRGAHALLQPERFADPTRAPLDVALPFTLGLLALLGVAFGYVLAAQERAHNRLRHLASRDALTGLVNRRTYETRRARALAQLRRSADPLGLALLDIDDFKRINDEHGHVVGDLALRHLADVLKPRLRRPDTLARWGGEEFALLLPATPAAGVQHLMSELRAALKDKPLKLAKGGELVLTVSIGWIALRGGDTPPASERLMRALDLAMYEVKHNGKDGEREAMLVEPGEETVVPLHELPDTDHGRL
ncbi:MAG: GGDEF domain-containing protein [Burkholderiales bacterium]|uniref:GGDEF domain-containing protein n=1 Tax=Inhella sp. TaxID=1921806 RepID=UPI001AC9758A|nr:GGDEF domain-containing protein [Burkholderiales bacterium]